MDDLLMNIKICERRKLLGTDKDFISRLYEVIIYAGVKDRDSTKGNI